MKKSLALDQRGDSPMMKEAIALCRSLKVDVRRKTDFQLKIGLVNYYPDRGTIFIDQIGTLADSGILVLKSILAGPHRTLPDLRGSLAELNLLPTDGGIYTDNEIWLG